MSCEGKHLGKRVILKKCKHFIWEENGAGRLSSKLLGSAMVSSTLLPWERTQWPRSPQRHRGAPQQWLLEVLASQQVSHAGAPLPRLLPRSMTARSLSTQTLHLITYCQDHLAIQTFCQKLLAIQTFSQKVYVLFWHLFRYFWKREKKRSFIICIFSYGDGI